MNDFDLDRLGDVWRQQPDPAELERLRKSAAAVARRARLAQIVDVGAAIAVGTAVIVLVLSNPTGRTFLLGGAALIFLLGSNIRQRRLRQLELKSLTGGTEDMLDQSIERIEATLRHNRLSLILMGPMVLVGAIFMTAANSDVDSAFQAAMHSPALRILAVAALAGVAAYLLYAIRRGRRELGRLRAMREAYRQEREKSAQ
ncbi:MAG TPA: hypothetical protein VEC11_01520 [Allosphingosinicella sp.]|nr:hypothetical protein [Allosphingosinicella sp.]